MTGTSTRHFVVMRHGKAEPSASSDHERELTARGRADSRAAGTWLAAEGLSPDVVLVSSAARARSTCDEVCAALTGDIDVQMLDSLYGADEYDVIATCVDEIPAGARCALVIGHNPTMAMTAALLQPEGDRQDLSLPTAALVVLAIAPPWAELKPGCGSLLQVHTPHD